MVSDSHSERPVLIDLRNLAGSRDRKRQACRLALRCRAWPDDEQTLLDAIHHYRSAGEKRIRRPGAVVGRCVVPWKKIKESNLAQYSLFELVRRVYDGQSVFVGVETDFTVAIDRIRPLVDDALRFVRVTVKTEAPS